MPIYKVKLFYSGDKTFEIEAKDEETAIEKANEELLEADISPDQVDDSEVWLSDCQYSDQQELKDREKDL